MKHLLTVAVLVAFTAFPRTGETTPYYNQGVFFKNRTAAGKYSLNSINFDGTNNYVSIGDISQSVGSVSFWFKSSQTTEGYLFSKVKAGGDYAGEFRVFIRGGMPDKWFLEWEMFGTSSKIIRSNAAVNNGAWHQFVGVFNVGMKMYLDGVLQTAQETTIASGLQVTGVNLEYGRNNGLLDSYLNGNVDDVAIYDAQLTQAQVTELYNGGVPADLTTLSTQANLVHWWKMGDGATHPTIPDAIGANNGTMTGTVAGDIVSVTP